MIVKKPTILIYTVRPDATLLREICAGIEEEGVLYEILPRVAGDASSLGKTAAQESMLGSGVGLHENIGALYMRGMGTPVLVTLDAALTPEKARALGANSARVIKKLPLRLDENA